MKNSYLNLLNLALLVVLSGSGCSDKTDSDGTQALLNKTNESGITGEIRRSEFDTGAILNQLEAANADSVIDISLFDDVSIHGRLIRKSTVLPGVNSYRYELDKPGPGILLISVDGSKISANIDLTDLDRIFTIQPVHNTGDHVVIEIDPAKMDILDGGSPLTPEDL